MRNGLKWDHHALFPSYLERTLKSVRFCTFHISVSLSLCLSVSVSLTRPATLLCPRSQRSVRIVFAIVVLSPLPFLLPSPDSIDGGAHGQVHVPHVSVDVDGGGGVEWARLVSSFPRSPLTFTSAGQGRGWPQQTVQRMFLKLSYSIRNGMECKGLVDCGYHHDGNLEQCRYFQIRPSHRGHTAGDIAVHFKLSAFVTHPHLRTMCAQGPKS